MATNMELTPPKGPLGSFFHFQREKTQEMRQTHPGRNMADITKLLGQAYRKLPITEKKKYEDLAAIDKERYRKEYQEYAEKCQIYAPKRRKGLPTDNEEYLEDPPKKKKRKGNKANDINPFVRRNSKNQVCFVEVDELTGKETLIPYVYLLNEMISSMPESEVTPELQCQIEALMQEDKEDIEKCKGSEKKMSEDLGAADQERNRKELEESTEECKIHATKSTNSMPTDDDEENKENLTKEIKDDKAEDIKKETNENENKIEVEATAEPIPHSNHQSSYLRRNSLNRVCFVEVDKSTGEETLVPAIDTLNEIINSIPEAKLDPELRHKIEMAMQEDREDIEMAKEVEKK